MFLGKFDCFGQYWMFIQFWFWPWLFFFQLQCKLVKSLVAPRGCKKDASFPFGPIKFFAHTSIHLDRIGLHTFRFPPEERGLGGPEGGHAPLRFWRKKNRGGNKQSFSSALLPDFWTFRRFWACIHSDFRQVAPLRRQKSFWQSIRLGKS